MRKKLFYLFLPALFSLLFCARQAAPPGGPVDKTPPRILATWPRSDSTRVATDAKIELLFGEAVDHRSVQEAIFITPLPAEGVDYQWHGKRLEIKFTKGLLPGRTYVITVGAGVKDRRNNPMLQSFSFAFATGDSLDTGSLNGRIYADDKIEGIRVWAYDLTAAPDPDPARIAPLYVTQAGMRGEFDLSHLALGRYRLFAVGDRDLNSRYDAEREPLAVASSDFELTPSHKEESGIILRLALRDTSPPILAAITAPDRRHADLRFSEKMSDEHLSQAGNYLVTSAVETLSVKDAFVDQRNPAYVHLLTAPQTGGRSYLLRILAGHDLDYHPLPAAACTLSFAGSGLDDSSKPYLIATQPTDRRRDVPADSVLQIFFSESMDSSSVRRSVCLQDSGSQRIPLRLTWPNGAQVQLEPESPLKSNRPYRIKADVDSIFDSSGNRLADTSLVVQFRTLNSDTLSEISGTVADAESLASGKFFLRARVSTGAMRQLQLERPGPYRFDRLMPGSYSLDLYRDQNGNGRFDWGCAHPFSAAERYYVYPDTVQVRSRWPNEGNDIVLPK